MAFKLFQSIISKLAMQTDRTIGILDYKNCIIACSDSSFVLNKPFVYSDITNNTFKYNGFSYKKLSSITSNYLFFAQGDDDIANSICSVASTCIESMKSLYDEKYDKSTFLKNVILDNILPGDIYTKSNDMHFKPDIRYAVFLIRILDEFDMCLIDILNKQCLENDFTIHISNNDIAFIKQIEPNTSSDDISKISVFLKNFIKSETAISPIIGIGSVANAISDISKSYKEAKISIDVNSIFNPDYDIVDFTKLGLGRLVYQLPVALCEMFLSEVFRLGSIEALDDEILVTIKVFFENSLNVSETSRKLFVHRNTLVYRLDKIYKITGLDLREFDDAIIFKLALMVRRYLDSR